MMQGIFSNRYVRSSVSISWYCSSARRNIRLLWLFVLSLALGGCSQYKSLDAGWSQQGPQWGRLGFYRVVTDSQANFRLQPDVGILVAYEQQSSPTFAAQLDTAAETVKAWYTTELNTREVENSQNVDGVLPSESVNSDSGIGPEAKPPVDLMEWIALAQSEVLRRYFADAPIIATARRRQALTHAQSLGLPLVFYVRANRRDADDLTISCTQVTLSSPVLDQDDDEEDYGDDGSSPMPVQTSMPATREKCKSSFGVPWRRAAMSFWLYDVQNGQVVHSGHLKLASLRSAKSPAAVLQLIEPGMHQLVRRWLALSW